MALGRSTASGHFVILSIGRAKIIPRTVIAIPPIMLKRIDVFTVFERVEESFAPYAWLMITPPPFVIPVKNPTIS